MIPILSSFTLLQPGMYLSDMLCITHVLYHIPRLDRRGAIGVWLFWNGKTPRNYPCGILELIFAKHFSRE